MTFIKRYPIVFFLVATVVITYILGIAIYLALRALGIDNPWVNNFVLRFGPTLAGVLTIALISGRQGLSDLFHRCMRWRFSILLYLGAVMIQPVILLIVLFLRGFGQEIQSIRPEMAIGVFASQLLLTVFIGAGFGEEIGWRGFMQPRLGERYSPLVASLLVGIAWFAWHIPSYVLNSDREASDPILPFMVIIFPFSIILAWGYFRSKESLLLPALLHGSIDAAWDTMVILLPGVVGTAGFEPAFDWTLAGFWCALAIIVVVKWGFRLGKEPSGERGNGTH